MRSASAAWSAIGTRCTVFTTDPAELETATRVVRAHVDAIDRACSRFRADSELSRASRAGGRWKPVSELCFDAIAAGIRAAQLTDGLVDPTVGRSLRLAGYDRDFAAMNGGPKRVRFVAAAGWRAVELDASRHAVRVPAGVEIDLGATAKALTADRAAGAAAAQLDGGVLVNLGGDLAAAGPPPAKGWDIRVTDDHAASFSAPGETVSIASGGLATSSVVTRRWKTPTGTAHHILDPASGRPVDSVWRTVSVAAGSCLDANIAATAALIRGPDAPAWLTARRLPARLVRTSGDVVRVGGWPREDLR